MQQQTIVAGLLFGSPIIAGAVVAFAKPEGAVTWVDGKETWLSGKRGEYAGKTGYINRFFLRPLFAGLSMITGGTKSIEDPFMRSGVRITSYLYFIGILLYLAFVATAIIVTIALIMVGFWILSFFLDGGSGTETVRVRKTWSGRTVAEDSSGKEVGSMEKAWFTDDVILKDAQGKSMGRITKAALTNDLIVKDGSGKEVGRITDAILTDDKVLKDASGSEIGRIRKDALGDTVIDTDKLKFQGMFQS